MEKKKSKETQLTSASSVREKVEKSSSLVTGEKQDASPPTSSALPSSEPVSCKQIDGWGERECVDLKACVYTGRERRFFCKKPLWKRGVCVDERGRTGRTSKESLPRKYIGSGEDPLDCIVLLNSK